MRWRRDGSPDGQVSTCRRHVIKSRNRFRSNRHRLQASSPRMDVGFGSDCRRLSKIGRIDRIGRIGLISTGCGPPPPAATIKHCQAHNAASTKLATTITSVQDMFDLGLWSQRQCRIMPLVPCSNIVPGLIDVMKCTRRCPVVKTGGRPFRGPGATPSYSRLPDLAFFTKRRILASLPLSADRVLGRVICHLFRPSRFHDRLRESHPQLRPVCPACLCHASPSRQLSAIAAPHSGLRVLLPALVLWPWLRCPRRYGPS